MNVKNVKNVKNINLMTNISNLRTYDPFVDDIDVNRNGIHITIEPAGTGYIKTVARNWPEDLSVWKILKYLKTQKGVVGIVVDDSLHLKDDKRVILANFCLEEKIATYRELVIENLKSVPVDLRIQQMMGRKKLTIIQGLAEYIFKQSLSFETMTELLRKHCQSGGSMKCHDKFGLIISIQGDHRYLIRDFLVSSFSISSDKIIIHG